MKSLDDLITEPVMCRKEIEEKLQKAWIAGWRYAWYEEVGIDAHVPPEKRAEHYAKGVLE